MAIRRRNRYRSRRIRDAIRGTNSSAHHERIASHNNAADLMGASGLSAEERENMNEVLRLVNEDVVANANAKEKLALMGLILEITRRTPPQEG